MTGEIVLLFSIPVVASLLAIIICLLAPGLVREYFENQVSFLIVLAVVIPGLYGSGLLAWNLSGSVLWVALGVVLGSFAGLQLANLVNRLLQRILYR